MTKKKRPIIELEVSIAGEETRTMEGNSLLMALKDGSDMHIALAGSFGGHEEIIALLSSTMKGVLKTLDPDEYLPVLLTAVAGALVAQAVEHGMPEEKLNELKEMLESQLMDTVKKSKNDTAAGEPK